MRVSALVRRAHQAGGSAMILAKGDPTGGAILVLLLDRGMNPRFRERGLGEAGRLIESGPVDADPVAAAEYWQRRRARDPDLWVVEVDVASGDRLADETIASG
ncbi:hypothetical protein COC42_09720 [Sphingomonas spermidinifaciens]|uniref:DUF1491 domain-containing protein n=2 Tax=Sphingomonas spermidinifaciens TaxID=1141889 RepID=A0A2A4B8R5_9SPHN|nr:DUF1491 family protein [Sphingomonas spermidinifaciens]PCD04831.1 hypothetical protein COC42_09720 [Sphingomonas spermidinifaciens]